MGSFEPVDPLGSGGEQDPVAAVAGADRDPGGQMGLARARRAQENHVLLGRDEVQGAQVSDLLPLQPSGVVEVELLQALAGWELRRADAAFAAVGFSGGDLALQTGQQELLEAPGFGAGPFGQAGRRLAQRGCFQRPGGVGQLTV